MFWFKVLVLILYFNFKCCASEVNGYTSPKQIVVEETSNVFIICGLIDSNDRYAYSLLTFWNNTDVKTSINYEMVYINQTTVRLNLYNLLPQISLITCMYEHKYNVSHTKLIVGKKPELIPKIDCISNNWVDMTCSFKKPRNIVSVQYNLTFKTNNYPGNFYCQELESKDPNDFSCIIDSQKYPRRFEMFYFSLQGTNILGNLKQNFMVNNYASIQLQKPEIISITLDEDNAAIIEWTVSKSMQAFTDPFNVEISLSSKCSKSIFHQFHHIYINRTSKTFKMNFYLDYFNVIYAITLRMKVSKAPNEMWSQWTSTQIKGISKVPRNKVKINSGSFELLNNKNLRVFWNAIPKCRYNGDGFYYDIQFENGNKTLNRKVSSNYIEMDLKHFNMSNEIKVIVSAANNKGVSEKSNSMIIPRINDILKPPSDLIKSRINGSYILKWSKSTGSIVSYTIFWCYSKFPVTQICDGLLSSKTIPASLQSYRYPVNSTHIFAISANSNCSSSGMKWF